MANYLDRISKDAKEKEVAAKKSTAEKAAINVQAAVYQAKTALNEAKSDLEGTLSSEPFSVDNYLDALAEVKTAQETFDNIKALQRAEFEGLISE